MRHGRPQDVADYPSGPAASPTIERLPAAPDPGVPDRPVRAHHLRLDRPLQQEREPVPRPPGRDRARAAPAARRRTRHGAPPPHRAGLAAAADGDPGRRARRRVAARDRRSLPALPPGAADDRRPRRRGGRRARRGRARVDGAAPDGPHRRSRLTGLRQRQGRRRAVDVDADLRGRGGRRRVDQTRGVATRRVPRPRLRRRPPAALRAARRGPAAEPRPRPHHARRSPRRRPARARRRRGAHGAREVRRVTVRAARRRRPHAFRRERHARRVARLRAHPANPPGGDRGRPAGADGCPGRRRGRPVGGAPDRRRRPRPLLAGHRPGRAQAGFGPALRRRPAAGDQRRAHAPRPGDPRRHRPGHGLGRVPARRHRQRRRRGHGRTPDGTARASRRAGR